jgi:hypothetical protein
VVEHSFLSLLQIVIDEEEFIVEVDFVFDHRSDVYHEILELGHEKYFLYFDGASR